MTKFTGNFSLATIETGQFPFVMNGNDWLVSITDVDRGDANIVIPFDEILRLSFDDVESDMPGCTPISEQQADQLVQFITKANEAGANVWAHCHAGMCRSGAVVDILILLGWTDAESHLSPKRIPNRLVHNMLRKRFPQLAYSWE